jgi:RNA polymerase sigma factor (sigma-70 family)
MIPPETATRGRSAFVATRWSVVMAVGRGETSHAQAALEELCQTYWQPLYAFLRRQGQPPAEAEDLTQAFFAQLLKRNAIRSVAPEKGRFRSFLLASLKHFVADEWDKARAQKRGGGKVISLDLAGAETRLGGIASDAMTPEKVFERRWAMTLLEQVYERLEIEYRAQGKQRVFEVIRCTLAGESHSRPHGVSPWAPWLGRAQFLASRSACGRGLY